MFNLYPVKLFKFKKTILKIKNNTNFYENSIELNF